MKKSNFLSLGVIFAILLVSLLNIAIDFLNHYTLFIFTIVLMIITYFMLGYHKNKSVIRKDVILSITAFIISYYLITYVLGYFVGFTKTIYALNFKSIISNIFPILIFILSSEFLRYMINTKVSNKTWIVILSFVAFVMLNNTLTLGDIFNTNMDTMDIVAQLGLFIFPSIAMNLLATYMTIKIDYKPIMIYRLLMEVPLYILPIFPNFGNYIESVLRISFPIAIFLWLYKKIDKSKIKKIVIIEKKHLLNIFRFNVLLFCAILVYFISGLFRYQALVIATGSMNPSIKVGDIVVVDKGNKRTETIYDVGDVIAYQKDNLIICHRIVKTLKSGNVILYETKGDNNTSADELLVNEESILGKVKYRVKYLGYPTIILNKIR